MMRHISLKIAVCAALLLLSGIAVPAQVKKPKTGKPKTTPAAPGPAALSNEDINFGLKDALTNGVIRANSELSRKGGFYNDPRLKLAMPPAMLAMEKNLRALKYDDLADDFIVLMNQAAEQSVIEATYMINEAVRRMAVQDAKKILAGPKDAATQYFRKTSEAAIRERILPVVMTANFEAGVLQQFKVLEEKNGGPIAAPAVGAGQKPFDINEYVTQKMLDGIFLIMAEEEKRIREVPEARTTTILQKVFR